ncbi:MAG: type II secretion system protein GspD [Tepidisphaerales bacterium]
MARQRTHPQARLAWMIPWMGLAAVCPGWNAGAAEMKALTAAAPQAQPAKAARRVTNLWVETDLRQVIQDIASQTDTVIVCDQTVQGMVSMSVKDMSIEDCLERACAAGGCSFVMVKDYYLVGKAEPGSPLFQRMSEPLRVKLSHVQPDQVKGMLHTSMTPYVTYDKASGTIMVTAPDAVRQRVLDAVQKIDQPNRQVAIDAVVFELTQEGSKQLGLDWQFKSGHYSARSDNLVNSITYGAASDLGTYVDATLRAIVETRKGQVLANPRVLVVNNTEAEIFVGQEKYFTLLSGQASNPYYTLQSIKAGVTLRVSPSIGDTGQIMLSLEPEVSDVVAEADQSSVVGTGTGAVNSLPVVTRRHAKTVVNVTNDQTVLIGGLLREQNRSVIDKTPVAGDIPGLGAAFRNVQTDKQQQEVVILITAHIVDPSHTNMSNVTSRLEPRYITPLDATAAPVHEQARPK